MEWHQFRRGSPSVISGALTKACWNHPDVKDWYARFLQEVVLPHSAFWSHIIAWRETRVGVALVLGIFTGIAAFFGSFMNLCNLQAGTVSINPILFVIATWLVLAWKTASGGVWIVGSCLRLAPHGDPVMFLKFSEIRKISSQQSSPNI
jgi:uncharacterized membrane protein YphA (DoxX/SURF4 family)